MITTMTSHYVMDLLKTLVYLFDYVCLKLWVCVVVSHDTKHANPRVISCGNGEDMAG